MAVKFLPNNHFISCRHDHKFSDLPVIPTNPFCTRYVRPGVIDYLFADDRSHVDSICDLAVTNHCLIVGPHGSGKSTLLGTLLPRLNDRFHKVLSLQLCDPSLRHPSDRRRRANRTIRDVIDRSGRLGSNDLLIIDGMEQLPWWLRWRLCLGRPHRTPRILATSHQPLRFMKVVFRCEVSRHHAVQLTDRLIDGCDPRITGLVQSKLANQDWQRSLNLRDFWFACYDDVQRLRQADLSRPSRCKTVDS